MRWLLLVLNVCPVLVDGPTYPVRPRMAQVNGIDDVPQELSLKHQRLDGGFLNQPCPVMLPVVHCLVHLA